MEIDIKNLPKSPELLERIIFELQSELTSYREKYARLLEELNLAKQRRFSSSSEKDPLQGDLFEVGRSNTAKSYMWCYRGSGNKPNIVYEYQETRGGYHAQKFLSGFKGYLQTDAYSGYSWVNDDKDLISVGCHAHARRPLAELAKLSKTPGLAHEALKFYRKLYTFEKEARENNLSLGDRYKLRIEKSLPVLEAFKKWLGHYLTKTPEQGKIGKAIRYCLSNWAELTGYLKDGRIEIDNNLIENSIRP
jgi:hypothetical protein